MLRCTIRNATIRDSIALQDVYAHMHPNDPEVSEHAFRNALALAIDDPLQHIIVGELDGPIVAVCTLYILSNLTRGCRPFGLIENVVTHRDHRRLGYGRQILAEATERAANAGCYKLMLMTGSKRDEVLAFYEAAGFKQNKTGFQIRF
ncbi:GNAT family N-acetyltransferase [Maritalea porphyrae]|uniref:Acetyltransferase n=1 Tax=Maritalea porphyrae TaxID=880732 RepID=A0ABQ5USD5_9HYPH|nr:GNAT family N-acetyltransferase [Maritalea porphyrae]GLQ17567.1 acetyltransferase [Maritalea porphyrae]